MVILRRVVLFFFAAGLARSPLEPAGASWFSRPGRSLLARLRLDPVIGFLLFCLGLYAYTGSLAPTVLEGDAALFQYTPSVLGVTYPTGYPFYILLGKAWVSVFPFGELAWRMNLLSALSAALALPLVYGAARRLLAPATPNGAGRWGGLAAVLIFATLPTFWRWATETKIYGLNILLFSGVLYTLARVVEKEKSQPLSATPRSAWPLLPAALLLGLQVSVHSTTVLLLPGLFLLAWLYGRRDLFGWKRFWLHLAVFILPGLLYFYIPLRAEGLIAAYGREEAITRGLLADFYHSGWAGWVRYFSAADFTGGVVTNWGQVPGQFFTVYVPLLVEDFTRLGAGLGLVGALGLALTRPRLFGPLFLIYAMPIPFVLTYGQGEQSAFLLPSYLIFSIFAGYALVMLERLLAGIAGLLTSPPAPGRSRFSFNALPPIFHGSFLRLDAFPGGYWLRLTFYVLRFIVFIALVSLLILPQARYNVNWLDAKWSRAIYDEWADALAHPLPPGAGVLAHWGDLTSFWYMQVAEGFRPDLRGIYPPTEAVVIDYLGAGGDLFIAGPLQGWAAGIEERYQLLPWGRLVRIAPRQADPHGLLPALPYGAGAVFDQKLRLAGFDYAVQAVDASDYPVTLAWQALADLPPDTTISLRLSQGDTIVAQWDDTLLSGWFPRESLPPGQFGLSYVPIPIPVGTPPGQYRLQMVAYTSYKHPWPLADGQTLLDLGEVELILPPAGYPFDAAEAARVANLGQRLPGYDFNGEIGLAGYEYTAARVGQGKGFAVKLLWQAKTRPEDNYVLQAELIDAAGRVLRSVQGPPAGGRLPTAGWRPGQFIRDSVDFVLPASAPVGEAAVLVRLSWLRPDGSRLNVRRWSLPVGEAVTLAGLEVAEKEDRQFDGPAVQAPVGVNLENKARLIGYNSPVLSPAGPQPVILFDRSVCAAGPEACQIHFDFYWQGQSEMDQLYFVFLHLVDAEGNIKAQHDLGPGKRGKEPTTSWLPGEVILDPVDLVLRPDLAAGTYTLRLGMYLPPDGPRLAVLDGAGQPAGDFAEVGTVKILP